MSVLAPYAVGVVTAPLVARFLKPLFRGIVKASVGATLEAKKAAAEVREEYQDIAAEAALQKVAANKAANAARLR
jgi:Protein of unknown function (DUF5132)